MIYRFDKMDWLVLQIKEKIMIEKKVKLKRKRISGINCQQIGDVFLIDVVCQFVVKLENSNQPILLTQATSKSRSLADQLVK